MERNNENRPKKKTSIWREFWEVYKIHFLIIMSTLAFFFVPFGVGKIVGPILVRFEIIYSYSLESFLETWITGFVILLIAFILSLLVMVIICLFIECVDNTKSNIKIIKNMIYLPVTEDEFKTLNINSFEEFDKFILTLFRINRTYSTEIKDRLVLKFKECYKTLPLPDDVTNFTNEGVNERYKNKYIELRGKTLACKITENKTLYNKYICELKDMKSEEYLNEFYE